MGWALARSTQVTPELGNQMAQAGVGQFTTRYLVVPLVALLPERFRLTFAYEAACVAGLGAAHVGRLSALTSTVEFSTRTLLATAALRHSGTPYGGNSGVAMAKELVLWSGWLGVRQDGALRIEQAHNAGRLIEVSSSLGEAVALELAIAAFGVPLALWSRVPETGGLSMDFVAPGASGDIAIEAKCGHGSVVADRKKKILAQKSRQTRAAEKYGFVLCYEMAGRGELGKKGSHITIVDPPGDQEPATPARTAVLRHYSQLASSIGLDWLQRYLDLLMEPSATPESLAKARDEALRKLSGYDSRRRIRQEEYLGRYFDVRLLLAGEQVPMRAILRSSPFFFFGIAASVIRSLLESNVEDVLKITRSRDLAFTEEGFDSNDPILVTVLSDGVARVDFLWRTEIVDGAR